MVWEAKATWNCVNVGSAEVVSSNQCESLCVHTSRYHDVDVFCSIKDKQIKKLIVCNKVVRSHWRVRADNREFDEAWGTMGTCWTKWCQVKKILNKISDLFFLSSLMSAFGRSVGEKWKLPRLSSTWKMWNSQWHLNLYLCTYRISIQPRLIQNLGLPRCIYIIYDFPTTGKLKKRIP